MKIKPNFWVAFLLTITLGIFNRFLNDSSIERTIYFLVILMIFNYLISKNASENFNLHRSTRETRQQVGQYINEKYELENNKNRPVLWATIQDQSHLTEENISKTIAWIPAHGKTTFFKQALLRKRGVYNLGPTGVQFGDPFGFFSRHSVFQSIEKVVVLPRFEKMSSFPEPVGFYSGGTARKTRNTEVSPFAVSVREYTPGDPLKRIHWKSSAKTNKLMVKEFDEDPQSVVWILLDGDKNLNYQTVSTPSNKTLTEPVWGRIKSDLPDFENSFELAVSIAASMCDFYLRGNRVMGFCANGQQNITISPEAGTRQLDKVLELLASIQNVSKNSIIEFLLSQGSVINKGSTLVIVSSNTTDEFAKALQQMTRKSYEVILLSVDPSAFNAPINTDDFYKKLENNRIKYYVIKNKQLLHNSLFGG